MIAPNGVGEIADDVKAQGKEYLLLRLRSGDAIYMTQEARFAWHGVPKVLKGTCPEWLQDWPAEEGKYEGWKGWMKNKRINLNVRQMRE
ncbi:Alpha-ketoglutarate-dependent dioxygenase abh1 like protein [Verticillium longisporum]|nr:Alpha-ketoglutarate-dependent dioxygenase abh1 like protein [Verticillium longisporum]